MEPIKLKIVTKKFADACAIGRLHDTAKSNWIDQIYQTTRVLGTALYTVFIRNILSHPGTASCHVQKVSI